MILTGFSEVIQRGARCSLAVVTKPGESFLRVKTEIFFRGPALKIIKTRIKKSVDVR